MSPCQNRILCTTVRTRQLIAEGLATTRWVMSDCEKPNSWRVRNLAARVFSTSRRSHRGFLDSSSFTWVSSKPWLLKKPRTESGCRRDAMPPRRFEALVAFSGEKPHDVTRYSAMKLG
ncbi:hypothetical protein C4D60_Mb06t00220 [Musa balbisiana]|uniref:Uncharacterized protein n=1 Tax=Musa balbisiana TaxID=52838 RepID=A0A4S8IJI7_MUSBA|nr:hypothetical protein C4D60_Mb06t00220 [Musa balbisiana]